MRPHSGVERRRGCVEECLTLNADELVRRHLLRLDERTSGVLRWIDGAGATVGAVRYEAELTPGEERGWLELDYCVGPRRFACRVKLITTRPRLGGRRWWFECPAEGRRVGRLHLPLVGLGDLGRLRGSEGVPPVWAGRRAHRLQYASQREAKWARSARRMVKGIARLRGKAASGHELERRRVMVAPRLVGGNGERSRRTIGVGPFAFVWGAGVVDVPPKPWKMRWATYQKHVIRILGRSARK